MRKMCVDIYTRACAPHRLPSDVILIIYIRLKVKRANRWAQLCRSDRQVFRSISPKWWRCVYVCYILSCCCHAKHVNCSFSPKKGAEKIITHSHRNEKRDKLWFQHIHPWRSSFATMVLKTGLCIDEGEGTRLCAGFWAKVSSCAGC